MIEAFKRIGPGVLLHMGQGAFLLRGADRTPCRANVEFDVVMDGPYNDAMVQYDLVTVHPSVGARLGDIVEHPDGTYRLEKVVANNGTLCRFAGVKVA